jgi:RNA polymerase sigma-70 factor (ECF subfamily)
MRALASAGDGELVRESLGGSAQAFSLLVQRHQDALHRYGVAFGLDGDTALDLLQETFIRAHERLAQCRDAERFRAWVFRIYRNAMLDWQRDIRRSEVSSTGLAEPVDPTDHGERMALREAIGGALAGLPAILREAFLLRHQAGHSYEEIAEATGVTVSAAKMRVMRAREILRDALAPDYVM